MLPAAVELSAYRIVEQLLDALEDAPDVAVGVRFRDDAVELAVSGPARRRARAAIERARERARLQRGTFEATVRGGHAEAVVSLPRAGGGLRCRAADLLLGAVAAVLGAAASVAEGLDPLGIAASFVLGGGARGSRQATRGAHG